MKRFYSLIALFTLLSTHSLWSQLPPVVEGDGDWFRWVAVMYPAPGVGRVGIGTTQPGTLLDITGPNRQLRLTDSDDGKFWQLSASSNALGFRYQEDEPDERLALWLNSSGNVGIGTTNPGATLDVIKSGITNFRIGTSNETNLHITNFNAQLNDVPGSALGMQIIGPLNSHIVMDLRGNENGDGFFVRVPSNPTASQVANRTAFAIHSSGRVGIGTSTPRNTLDVNGTTITSVLTITGGFDLAEQFNVNESSDSHDELPTRHIKSGIVVCIDKKNPGQLTISTKAYDRTVAGIISGAGGIQPGMLMGQNGSLADGSSPVALTGRVYCWADASLESIEPGDLLTTSNTVGHAMKVIDYNQAQGAILGKAMSSLEQGKGLVLVLVSLQ